MLEENKNKIEDVKRELYDPNDKSTSHQREGIYIVSVTTFLWNGVIARLNKKEI